MFSFLLLFFFFHCFAAWPCLALFGSVWLCLALFGPAWPCLTLVGTGTPGPPAARTCLCLFSYCLALSGPVWPCLALSGSVWMCLALFGNVSLFSNVLDCLAMFGIVFVYLGNLILFMYLSTCLSHLRCPSPILSQLLNYLCIDLFNHGTPTGHPRDTYGTPGGQTADATRRRNFLAQLALAAGRKTRARPAGGRAELRCLSISLLLLLLLLLRGLGPGEK